LIRPDETPSVHNWYLITNPSDAMI